MATKAERMLATATKIVAYAEDPKHYVKGWDVIAECYTPEDFAEHAARVGDNTAKDMWATARFMASVHQEGYANARNSAF